MFYFIVKNVLSKLNKIVLKIKISFEFIWEKLYLPFPLIRWVISPANILLDFESILKSSFKVDKSSWSFFKYILIISNL